MLKWLKRNVDARPVEDPQIIENILYNSMSGGQKNLMVGPALEYLGALSATKTAITEGDQLYILNVDTAIAYAKMGDNALVGPVPTAPGADTFACFPGQYTPYSAADYTHIIGATTLHVYILKDESRVRKDKSGR